MRNVKQLGIICLVLLAALAALGSSYAVWSQDLNINAESVSTAPAPVVVTTAATDITATAATLNGYLDSTAPGDSPVSVFFDYGLTTDYGSTVAASPAAVTAAGSSFSYNLTGLTEGQTYHFRVRATGFYTVFGADQEFTTTVGMTDIRFDSLSVGTQYYSTITLSGANTQTLEITYVVENNGHNSNGDVALTIYNSTDHWIFIDQVTVVRSTVGGNLNNLTTYSPSGSALGYFYYDSGTGGTTTANALIWPNSSSSTETVYISAPKHSVGTYTVTINFTYWVLF